MRDYAIGIAIGVVGLAALIGVSIAPSASATQVAAVFAPWTPPEQVTAAVAKGDIRFVRWGWNETIVVVDLSSDPTMRDELARTAWFLADPRIAGSCLAAQTSQ